MRRWQRCRAIVASGSDAPRTWRCWWPLPCPSHGGQPDVEVHVHVDPPRPQVVVVPVVPPRGWLR